MAERWRVLDGEQVLDGAAARDLVVANIDAGTLTTYFRSDGERLLSVVSNGSRAMVVLMSGPGDPGEHAASPGATGAGDGYALENGQEDTYADADTVPLAVALDAVESIVDTGAPPAATPWVVDR